MRPVVIPADATYELEAMAVFFENTAKTYPKRHSKYGMKRWLEGMRRGFNDAAASCRRRAARIRKAQREAAERFDAAELKESRRRLRSRKAWLNGK